MKLHEYNQVPNIDSLGIAAKKQRPRSR